MGTGNTLALTLAVVFNPSFKGAQSLFGYAVDNASLNSGWQTLEAGHPARAKHVPHSRFGDAEHRVRRKPNLHFQIFERERVPIYHHCICLDQQQPERCWRLYLGLPGGNQCSVSL